MIGAMALRSPIKYTYTAIITINAHHSPRDTMHTAAITYVKMYPLMGSVPVLP